MSRIHRHQFVQHFANQAINITSEEAKERLWNAGSSAWRAKQNADLNRDNIITGRREAEALYNFIAGSRESFETTRADGSLTKEGKLFNAFQALVQSGMAASEGTHRTSTTHRASTTHRVGHSSFGRALAEGGYSSMTSKKRAHERSIRETGIGLFYGDHSNFADMSRWEQQEWINANSTSLRAPSADRLEKSSCIAWAMSNVKAAYQNAGRMDRWNEIERIVKRNGMKGTVLAKELEKDGWTPVYWNADTNLHTDDNEHAYTASLVRRGKGYYGLHVKSSDVILNYRDRDPHNDRGIEKMRRVPFFFGLAHGGRHTFVGGKGKISEFHWASMPDQPNAIEERRFEDFPWTSGVILVPPGYWN